MDRPIVCRGIVTEQPVFSNTESGPRQTGYMKTTKAAKLHVRLKGGSVSRGVDQQDRIVETMHDGVHVQFDERGVLEVNQTTWESAGMTREACVAFLRAGAEKGCYEVVGEDEAKGDARKPVPAGAGK